MSGDEVENGTLKSVDLSSGNFEERFALAEIMRAKAVKIADKAMAKAEAAELVKEIALKKNAKKEIEKSKEQNEFRGAKKQ